MLKVNNEIVGNELGGTDLAVSVDWKKLGLRRSNEWLRTGEPELYSARSSAAFLCEFGNYWGPADQKNFLKELFSSCSHSLFNLKDVAFPKNGARRRIGHYFHYNSQNCGVYGSS